MVAEYVIDPLAPFPKRWRDEISPFRVMTDPVDGYVMCRRKGAIPFVMSVKSLLNAQWHPHGPFEILEMKRR